MEVHAAAAHYTTHTHSLIQPSVKPDTHDHKHCSVSERALGKYLKALEVPRSKVVIASKVLPSNCTSGKTIVEACDRSLKNLGMEYIDLYQVWGGARSVGEAS